jgi:hypothetical protein
MPVLKTSPEALIWSGSSAAKQRLLSSRPASQKVTELPPVLKNLLSPHWFSLFYLVTLSCLRGSEHIPLFSQIWNSES